MCWFHRVQLYSEDFCMRGMLGIGCSVALQHVQRPRAAGGTPCRLSVPGSFGGGSGIGERPRGQASRHWRRRCKGASVVRLIEALAAVGWRKLPGRSVAARPAARRSRGLDRSARGGGVQPPPTRCVRQRRTLGRRPQAPGAAFSRAGFGALSSAHAGVQPASVSGTRPSGPGKAAAFSRDALLYGAQASSLAQREPRKRASDDATAARGRSMQGVDNQRQAVLMNGTDR